MPGKNRKRTNHPPPSPSSSSEETSSERLSSEEEENYDDYNRNNDDLIADEYDHQSSDIDSDDEEDALDRVQGFTDENAEWLKRKRTADRRGKHKLLDSSSEDDGDDDVTDPDQDDNYDMEEQGLLEIERQSKFLDEQMEREYEEAEEELQQTMKDNSATFHLPTAEELELEETQRVVIPPTELRTRIDSILHVLADFRALKEPTRSRKEYLQQLNCDMAELFGYLPELVEYFLSIFGPAETLEFLSASDSPRPLVIRTNTIKVRRKDLAAALIKRGVSLDPLATWTKVGLKITSSTIPIGATPEYLSGHYMLQSAASLCPVMALDPQQQERILDMSAAPGGKTSYIAQLMRNTGTIIANDLKPDRQKATIANLHRLGVRNVITCSSDGRKLGSLWKNKFDRILLDAPCSGLGVISRDPSVKVQRTMKDIERCAVLQKELLLSAIDALNHNGKSKGIMVYSTCSVSVAENEEVVNYLLRKRHVKIVDTGLDFGKPGFTRYKEKRFHPSLALTRRFYPHVHNMDGFYVAKLQKLSDNRPSSNDEDVSTMTDGENKLIGPDTSKNTDEMDAPYPHEQKKARSDHTRDHSSVTKVEPNRIDAKANESKLSQKKKAISSPPARKAQVKRTIKNAKMTKPRRRRSDKATSMNTM